MSNLEPATILLIDDHPMLRTGVKQLVSMAPILPLSAKPAMVSRVSSWLNPLIPI
ncbi:Response regulatory domain-containing protein [Citrobacter freundii]